MTQPRQPGTAQHSTAVCGKEGSTASSGIHHGVQKGSVAHRQSTAITANTAVLHAQLRNAGQLNRQGSSVVVHRNC